MIYESKPKAYELFNLNEDVRQSKFVQDDYPDFFNDMKSKMDSIFYVVQSESPIWTNDVY